MSGKAQPKIGPKIVVDGEKEYKESIAAINKTLSVLSSEAKKTAAAYVDQKGSLEALRVQTEDYNNQAEAQRKKVDTLREAYENSKKQLGENAAATQDWLIKLNNAEAALMKTEKAIEDNEKAIKLQSMAINKVKAHLEEWKDKVEELKEKHPVLTGAMSKTNDAAKKLASGGMKAVAGAAAGTVVSLTAISAAGVAAAKKLSEIAEETKELRGNLNNLETSFTTNSHSAETATKTYTDLYAILGESDKATEAANHLALLTNNQKELSDWVTISTGVYGTFGNSLPIEGLTEAANETAKVGKLTGSLADALNWVGINEEDFQKKLDACSTEQERQTLITQTLVGKYGEAAEKFKEVNSVLIDSQRAQANYDLSMANLGETVDKIKNKLTAEFLPGITEVIDGVTALLDGDEGAAEKIKSGIENIVLAIEKTLPELTGIFVDAGELVAEVAPELVFSFANGILDNLDKILDAAFKIIESLTGGLLSEKTIAKLVSAALSIVTNLVSFLGDNVELIIDSAFIMIDSLIDGLLDDGNADKLVTAALDVVTAIVTGLIDNAPEMITGAFSLIGALVDALLTYDWWQVAVDIFNGIKDGLKSLITGEASGSHAGGLDYVPYDGYRAILHKGEKLLTASEAANYDRQNAGGDRYEELNRKIDALMLKNQRAIKLIIKANGTAGGVVRALKLEVEEEDERSSVFD